MRIGGVKVQFLSFGYVFVSLSQMITYQMLCDVKVWRETVGVFSRNTINMLNISNKNILNK